MEEFLQQLTNGLAVGGIYALIALGYTMVYGVLKLINFAHGDLFTYGAYLGLTLLTSLALTDRVGFAVGVLVLVLMVMGLVAILGAILERAAYRPLRESPRLSAVVSALGASIFLQNTLMLVYGAQIQVYPDGILPAVTLDFFGLYLPLMRVLIVLASVAMMIALYLFIQKTRIGTAIRAAAIDQGAARLMQPNLQRQAIKALLRQWEKQFPGRVENLFAALQNVAPSHLADARLFDFTGLGSRTGGPTPAWLPGGGEESEDDADEERISELLAVAPLAEIRIPFPPVRRV